MKIHIGHRAVSGDENQKEAIILSGSVHNRTPVIVALPDEGMLAIVHMKALREWVKEHGRLKPDRYYPQHAAPAPDTPAAAAPAAVDPAPPAPSAPPADPRAPRLVPRKAAS